MRASRLLALAGGKWRPVRQFWPEIALSAAALVAIALAFGISAAWGWRLLGAFILAAAAWVFWVAFLFPRLRPAYPTGKDTVALSLLAIAVGFGMAVNANALAAWTGRVCHELHLGICEGGAVCVNGDVVSVASPARSIRALRYVRSCPATSVVETHVSIIPTGQPLPDEPGNTFIVAGKADLLLFWIDGKHLAISGAGGAAPQLQKSYINGIRISYEERPR